MELTALVNKYKNNILNIAIILLALVISSNIYKKGAMQMEAIQREKEAAMKKNAIVAEIAQLETRIASYKNLVGKKQASSIINALSEIAKGSGVKITFIQPAAVEKNNYYTKINFDLVVVSAASYHALGKFISKIESHKDIYIVEGMEIMSGTDNQAFSTPVAGSEKKELSANIKLSIVEMAD